MVSELECIDGIKIGNIERHGQEVKTGVGM